MAQENIIKNRLKEAADIDPLQNSTSEELGELVKEKLTVKGKGAELVIRPKDKVNRNIWIFNNDILDTMNENAPIEIDTSRAGSNDKASIMFRAYYGELAENDFFGRLEEKLTELNYLNEYDKEVCIAAASVFYEYGDIMTLSQIHYTMGYNTKPNPEQLRKLKESLEKMRTLKIMIDNTSEHLAYSNIETFPYNGVVLPWESREICVNGQVTDAVIHLFREPPLMTLARKRNQITTISRSIQAAPFNKTPQNNILYDYLIDRITSIQREANKKTHKNKKASNRILYETVFEHLQLADAKAKRRVKEKIEDYLKHFKKEKLIKNYKKDDEGVSIIL